jgi:hypothetical protein
MVTFALRSYALSVGIACVVLAGCGGAGTTASMSPAVTQNGARRATSSGGDLLYVANTAGSIYLYSYPALQQVQTLDPNVGYYIAGSNPNDGDMCFVSADIVLWHHGGSTWFARLQELSDSVYFTDCTFDPTTNHVAAGLFHGNNGAVVAVYTDLSGSPTLYSDSNMTYGANFLAYDASGNLFVHGAGAKGQLLDELAKGSSNLVELHLAPHPNFGSLAWDGSHMTARDKARFYRLKVARTKVTTLGKTVLGELFPNPNDGYQIENDVLIGKAKIGHGERVGFWSYPAGGKPSATLQIQLGGARIDAIALSVAPTRLRIHK